MGGRVADLTSYQFDLLVTLAERAGRVLTRDQIMEGVRGRELDAFDRSIDVHMGRIRAAIEADAKTRAASSPCAAWAGFCQTARLSRETLQPFARRLSLRIWLTVVVGMAVLTLAVGWAWRVRWRKTA